MADKDVVFCTQLMHALYVCRIVGLLKSGKVLTNLGASFPLL